LRDFDAPEGAARVASVLIGVSSLTSLVIGPWLLQRMISGSFFFVESPALDALGTFSLFAFVAAAISVIAWCKRSYDNARALGATDLRYSSGWAIGGWLVPIANFFIPKRIADDLWRSSDPSLPTRIDGRWKFQPVHGILHLWWTVWMIQLLVGRAVERMAVEALNRGDLVDYRFALEVEGATELLFGFAGLLLIRIINDITARQRQRAELVRSLIGDRPVPAA
jgi:hypothetical protein